MRSHLGLDVVGSVTFGALSQGELDLALDVALPRDLNPKDLKTWVLNKKAAQEKLANYLSEQVRFLSATDSTLGDWEQHLINRSRMGVGPGAAAAAPATAPGFMGTVRDLAQKPKGQQTNSAATPQGEVFHNPETGEEIVFNPATNQWERVN